MNSNTPPLPTLRPQQIVWLDLIRGIAATSVLFHHVFLLIDRPELAHGIPLGSLGVTTFFLLSGFLIDQSAQRHAARNYDVRDFLVDRACRIYVCYVPALVFTALLVAPISERADFVGQPHFGLVQFLGNLLMLQDYPAFQLARRAGFDAPWFVHPYALAEPYWTVPIELYLYIAFGALYFSYVKRSATTLPQSAPSPKLLAALSIALLPVLYHAATGYGQCLTLTWLLGVLGSRLMSTRLAAPRRGFVALWLVASAVLLTLRVLSRDESFYDLQKVLFLGMLLLGGLWLAPSLRWLAHPALKEPSAFLAKTSYALYLTHNVLVGWTIMHLGKALTAFEIGLIVVCCHACAFVFWWAFDRHHKWVAHWFRSSTAANQPAEPEAVQSAGPEAVRS